MRDQLLGTTQPVLSISLDPGETVVAIAGDFCWMTDSIQMSATPGVDLSTELQRSLGESSLPLSAYTARQAAGGIAFASKLPGSIIAVDIAQGCELLIHRRGFLAGTPGIEVTTGYQLPYPGSSGQPDTFILLRLSGKGRAWIELSGDVIRRELSAGASLRTHPWHIGMFDASVAVQMAELQGVHPDYLGNDASRFAVLSGPGAVWLQSMQLLASMRALSADSPPVQSPALEGGAGDLSTAAAGRVA